MKRLLIFLHRNGGLEICQIKSLYLLLIMIMATNIGLLAQDENTYDPSDSVSAIDNANYKKYPTYYVRKIDSTKIPTGILIDRIKFNTDMGLFNGKSRVKTCDYEIFRRLLKQLKKAANDSVPFPEMKLAYKYSYNQMRYNHIYIISILNYKYSKINPKALRNKQLIETDSSLNINVINDSTFATKRVLAASPFNLRVHGDVVNFLIDSAFYFSNAPNDSIVKIEADFGNKTGWNRIFWDEPFTVSFGSKTDYILIKLKLTIKDKIGSKTKELYAHFTVLRTGSDLVPHTGINESKLKSTTVPAVDTTFYYPTANPIYQYYCGYHPIDISETGTCSNYRREIVGLDISQSKIEYNILFATTNTSGKFRKPIIICDGFDPGDVRNYAETYIESPTGDKKTDDDRGLYELMNGEPSKWSEDPGANLVGDLRNNGYDIVFVNWLDGAGDIPYNASYLRGFLNSVINSAKYRDNQTEEIILVGPSMAGLITRYCLTTMEKAGEEHHVKLWFSFDSPQEGANIPIELQWTINWINQLSSDNASTQSALGKLNTTAAQQMLLNHYAAFNGTSVQDAKPMQQFTDFYTQLHNLGYPQFSKNIAISNGGIVKLYPDNRSQTINLYKDLNLAKTYWAGELGLCAAVSIIATASGNVALLASEVFLGCDVILSQIDATVTVKGYKSTNNNASSQLFYGSAWATVDGVGIVDVSKLPAVLSTTNQIGFNNAPGGYHTALYDFNQNSENNSKPSTDTTNAPEYSKACFMPTVSAFGIVPTRDNIYKSWDQITPGVYPFDDIHGMTKYGNEEHCRVSDKTSDWLQKYLSNERGEIQKPYPHATAYNETESKACLYTANNTITFGGVSGNSFTIKSGADVKVAAPDIKFKPGFKITSQQGLPLGDPAVIN